MNIPSSLTAKASLRLAASALLVAALPARAEEPSLQELLRDGLFAEEVTRDSEAAARLYQQVLSRHAEHDALAATAIFRLAEVRRKQDRKDEAIQLFRLILAEFPHIEPQAKLARENLAAIGAMPPEPAAGLDDEETKDLARLRRLAQTSPDLARDPGELHEAAHANHPRVVKFLLDSGADPEASHALAEAAGLGHLEVVKLLLAKSEPLAAPQGGEALAAAAANGRAAIVRALLLAKVDPNWQPATCSSPFAPDVKAPVGAIGTPLMAAIQNGKKEAVAMLLEAKAAVNVPANGSGFTALHLAAATDAASLVERLIDLGADVNALSSAMYQQYRTAVPSPPRSATSVPISPLQFALACNAWEAAKALIRRGANLQQPYLFGPFLKDYSAKDDLPRIRFLLDIGADPNVFCGSKQVTRKTGDGDPFARITDQVEEFPIPLLSIACGVRDNALDLVRVLLAKGAKPGPELFFIVREVAPHDQDGALLKALLAQRPETVNLAELPNMSGWQPAARRVFLDEVVIPALAKEPGARMLFTNSGQWLDLSKPAGPGPGPATPELLQQHSMHLLLARPDVSQFSPSQVRWPNIALIRLHAGGKWLREELDLTGMQELPPLTRGDLLEITPQRTAPGVREDFTALCGKLAWHLRKRIAFPVTVEIAGNTREIQLRGDRMVFDPTRAEAPLVGAGKLMELLWQPAQRPEHSDAKVVVLRKDWPQLKRPLDDFLAKDFDLQSGDHVKLEVPNKPAKSDLNIVLKAAGDIPFACYFPIDSDGNENDPQLPTLIQALTYAMAPSRVITRASRISYAPPQPPGQPAQAVAAPPSDAKDLPASMVAQLGSNPQRILPHPDLSRLRIHRGGTDGQVIEVNLATAIAVPADQLSSDQARQADVQLQPGDLIEVPIRQDQTPTPWLGFTPQEERFFAKALNCKVSVTDAEGATQLKAIEYQQPRYVETAAGVIALPPTTGTATLAVSTASGFVNPSTDYLVRGDAQSQLNDWTIAFVRNGDAILSSNVIHSAQGRLPRPRVVPPPPQPQPVPPAP